MAFFCSDPHDIGCVMATTETNELSACSNGWRFGDETWTTNGPAKCKDCRWHHVRQQLQEKEVAQ